jgi:transcriptional regulator GlxA family with amidase domain
MLIYILALDGVADIALASFTSVIGTAQQLASSQADTPRLEMRLVGVRRRVRTAQGCGVPVVAAAALPVPDLVLLPGLGASQPETLLAALKRPDVKDAGRLMRRWVAEGARLGAACTATFLVADAGLLDGRAATTTWWLSALFRQRYPKVMLDESRMLVNAPPFTTGGATLSHLDLALGAVRSCSPSLAALCARYLLIEPRSSQSAFVIPDQVAHTDAMVERFEHWARGRLASGFSMSDAARDIGASERTLGRRLQTVLGKSPLEYFQDLRVEHAVHLLQTSDESLDRLANRVGYADGTTLRTLLRRKLGKGIRELRTRGA